MPFSDIIGQDHAVCLVRTTLERGIMPGSHLVYGPGGVGEIQLVRGICQALFCEKGKNDFCGKCRSCRRIEHGTHGDVHWLSAQTDWYSIEQIRELSRMAGMHPYEGEYQVFVLEEAERMRAEAANCLLKTLEEPSPHTVIILITTSPSALLPTILSRCRKIRLSALSREAVVEFLKSKGLGEKEAAEVAAFSGGRIDHLEEVLSGGFLAARREFVGLLRKIREEGDLGGLAFANTFRDREKAVEMLWWFARLARNALVSRMRKTEGEATDEAMDLFGPLNDAELIALFEKSADACQSIRGNANIELVLGSLLTDYAGGQR